MQALDAQLSLDVERTLSQANVQQPRRDTFTNSNLVLSTTTIATPQPARVPSTPPQLPYFNFGGLDLIGECPQLTPSITDSGYASPSLLTPTLPSWCPDLPSLSGANIKWSEFPLFFDLSKLPEPVHTPKYASNGRELQLWRPQPSPQPKKHSRFFPPSTSPKPNVKLPPISCKLHTDDKGVQTAAASKPKTVAESLEQAVKAAETARKLNCEERDEKSAANLWKILTSSEHPIRGDDNDLYPRSFSHQPVHEMYAAPHGVYDHRLESVGMPIELDSTPVPYVHANSLTGHANDRGSDLFPTSEEDVILFDEPANLAGIEERLGGLNEMVMDPYMDEGYTDALLAVLDLHPLPPSPSPYAAAGFPEPVDSVIVQDRTLDNELNQSDAHFQSERALFHPPSPRLRTPDEDLVDVATFLTMGHALNCWCNDCGEPPELIFGDTLVEDDDEWMVYSTTENERSPSVSSVWEWEWGTVVHDEEKKVERAPPPYQPSWDDEFPCLPSSVAHRAW